LTALKGLVSSILFMAHCNDPRLSRRGIAPKSPS
jgi:hypothetical protein